MIALAFVVASRERRKPPPPRLPARGYATASAKETAIAASIAFPPSLRASTPTWEAMGSELTTIPIDASIARRGVGVGGGAARLGRTVVMRSQTARTRTQGAFMGGGLRAA